MEVLRSEIPADSLVQKLLPADYSDVYRCNIPKGVELTPDDIQITFWTSRPPWVDRLFKLRNTLVKPFGLDTTRDSDTDLARQIRAGKSHGKMSVLDRDEHETVIALNDSHLRADMSVRIEESDGQKLVYLTTLVHFHNRMGRVYFFFIRPFHHLVVKGMLKYTLEKMIEKV